MSVINKEPFIKKLLASCSSEELDTLTTLINGGGNQTPIKRTANPIDTPEIPHISVSDKGIQLCSLTINYTNFLGYLVYTDLFCALISFTDAQVLKIFDLTEDKTRPNTIDEAINILELRSALFEAIGGSSEPSYKPNYLPVYTDNSGDYGSERQYIKISDISDTLSTNFSRYYLLCDANEEPGENNEIGFLIAKCKNGILDINGYWPHLYLGNSFKFHTYSSAPDYSDKVYLRDYGYGGVLYKHEVLPSSQRCYRNTFNVSSGTITTETPNIDYCLVFIDKNRSKYESFSSIKYQLANGKFVLAYIKFAGAADRIFATSFTYDGTNVSFWQTDVKSDSIVTTEFRMTGIQRETNDPEIFN